MHYTTTNCSTLLQSIVDSIVYIIFSTKCDIIPQCVTFNHRVWYFLWITLLRLILYHKVFLLQSVAFPINYPTINYSIVLQNIVLYHKNSILPKM